MINLIPIAILGLLGYGAYKSITEKEEDAKVGREFRDWNKNTLEDIKKKQGEFESTLLEKLGIEPETKKPDKKDKPAKDDKDKVKPEKKVAPENKED